ncbi:alpha/beta hydrolase [Fructilactobacillus sp. Tb1]|uniref:alpha/beta hydrolase n=1 Tax=Fructilactobacillus sp. Tb1 TaxID=3422304 RepID=UPI003D2E836A
MSKIFNKKDFFVLIVGILAVIIGFVYIQFGVGDGHEIGSGNSQQPIIFVSDQNKTSSAAQHLVTTTSRSGGSVAMHVDVYNDGTIKYLANKNVKRAKQPIIEVSFSDRTNTTKQQAAKLQEVFSHLNHKYGYTTYDAIGFGSGALAVYYNAINYGVKKNKMTMSHFISIAGPYKGVMPDNHNNNDRRPGQPADRPQGQQPNTQNGAPVHQPGQMQHQAMTNQQLTNSRFPSFSDYQKKASNLDENTKVLNIYGVLNANDKSDGRVTEQSATAIKSLVKSGNYQSLRLSGPFALHSNILDNQIAERLVNRFLFND